VPTYELVLWHQGNEAVRITDKPLSVGQTLLIDDIKWLVEVQELPRRPQSNSTLHLFTRRGDLLQPKHQLARLTTGRSPARVAERAPKLGFGAAPGFLKPFRGVKTQFASQEMGICRRNAGC
jgi:hypothetical protein